MNRIKLFKEINKQIVLKEYEFSKESSLESYCLFIEEKLKSIKKNKRYVFFYLIEIISTSIVFLENHMNEFKGVE